MNVTVWPYDAAGVQTVRPAVRTQTGESMVHDEPTTGRGGLSLSTLAPDVPATGSPPAARAHALRAWMLAFPVDLLAFGVPLAWNREYWKGVIVAALVTVTAFALGGLYTGRRHVSFLDELPSLCVRLLASAAIVAILAALRHDSVAYVGGFLRVGAMSAGG